MVALTAQRIAELLTPYMQKVGAFRLPEGALAQFSAYLDLILKWNAKTNLTAIREPEEIVRRHFGESVFLAGHLGECADLLDYGSGAGFPGLPVKIVRPDIAVTLAESQGKKAAFLREAARTLGMECEVWGDRVERMPTGRRFEVVAMRAVDGMELALAGAGERASGRVMVLGTATMLPIYRGALGGYIDEQTLALPGTFEGVLISVRRA